MYVRTCNENVHVRFLVNSFDTNNGHFCKYFFSMTDDFKSTQKDFFCDGWFLVNSFDTNTGSLNDLPFNTQINRSHTVPWPVFCVVSSAMTLP